MAEAGANPGLDLNLEVEADQSRLQSIPITKAEDKTDATNINLINVSVKLSINNSGNKVSQDQNLQFVKQPPQHLEQLDQIPQEQQKLRRASSLIQSWLRMLLGVLSLAQCRR